MMKWIVRIVVGLVVLLAVAVAAVYVLSGRRFAQRWDVEAAAVAVPTDDASLVEGRRLYVARGCADCHAADLGGAVVIDDFLAGRIAGPNLTAGTGGIGGRSDAELVKAIRHGLAPDGRGLLWMPSHEFYVLSDREIGAIVAAIRAAAPIDRTIAETTVGPLVRLLYLMGQVPALPAETIDHAAARPPAPVVGETAEYGAYLANLCVGCHGPGLSGGPIPGVPPDWPPSSNLTLDKDTGLGDWTKEQFVAAMRTGVRRDGSVIDPAMPWRNFAKMTDVELSALWEHLKTVPARPSGGR